MSGTTFIISSTPGSFDGSTPVGTEVSGGVAGPCPTGTHVLGGGGTIDQGNKQIVALTSSVPTGPSTQPTGWQAKAIKIISTGPGNGTAGSITSYVVCG